MTSNSRAKRRVVTDARSLRLRAAWMYYSHDLTQQQIAIKLGIGRSTVIRLLEEARERQEVRFWIEDGDDACAELAVKLELALRLDEAIVVPASEGPDDTARSVGLALGKLLSTSIPDNAVVGVGWGRTLTASLDSFRPNRLSGVRVMSLGGGTIDTRSANPVEYSWRLASALGAECYLFPAPLIVDSAETRDKLIAHCGLDSLYDLAKQLDVAIVSVGDISANSSSLSRNLMSGKELEELVAGNCICDVMCNFLDSQGVSVNHPINSRIMSISLDVLATAASKIIASGGARRSAAILAAIKRIGCDTLVTDEAAAKGILALLEKEKDRDLS